jgi:hypothetical protein
MFFEKGFIYTDNRLGAFVVPFSQLQSITFHFDDALDWIQFTMREGTDLLPAGLLTENTFYLHMPNAFCLERFQAWTKMFRNQIDVPTLEKVYSELTRVTESFSFINFMKNRVQYYAVYGSEYTNFKHW